MPLFLICGNAIKRGICSERVKHSDDDLGALLKICIYYADEIPVSRFESCIYCGILTEIAAEGDCAHVAIALVKLFEAVKGRIRASVINENYLYLLLALAEGAAYFIIKLFYVALFVIRGDYE